jgi:hypothetical protein
MTRLSIVQPLANAPSPEGWNVNSPGWARHEPTRGSAWLVESTPNGVEHWGVLRPSGSTPSGVVPVNDTVHPRLCRGLFTLKPSGLLAEVRA